LSQGQTVALGAIAGFTVFLGLPIGRLSSPTLGLRTFLNAVATGVLLFLFWDILSHAAEPVESALTAATDGGSWRSFVGLAATGVLGFSAGLLGLVCFERRIRRVQQSKLLGPGAASVAEFELPTTRIGSPGQQLALMIATGIGLHNFAEGLAIGQSAANDEVALALLLVIGFGLHNATEGFGIVAPLSGEPARPSWAFLGLLGLIAGGPTFVGTLVGQAWVSDTVSVAFLALAAGSILYVVMELVAVGRRLGAKELFAAGIVLGLVLGFATDFILVAAGA
jgi:ZIP family zinc transporter